MPYVIFPKAGSGTWTVPKYVHKVKVTLIGAGGGGAGGAASNTTYRNGAGGGGGGYVQYWLNVTPGISINCTIGSGGTSGAGATTSDGSKATSGAGGKGGDTTCTYNGNTCTAYGGYGATSAIAYSSGSSTVSTGGSGGEAGVIATVSDSSISKISAYKGSGGGKSGHSGSGSGGGPSNANGGGGGGVYSTVYTYLKNLKYPALFSYDLPMGGIGITVSQYGSQEQVFLDGRHGAGGAGGTAGLDKNSASVGKLGGSGGSGLVVIEYSQVKVYTSPTSSKWTVSSGIYSAKITMIGAGGGGGGSARIGTNETSEGGGGGGGACTQFTLGVIPGTSYAYTVGSGGDGGKGNVSSSSSIVRGEIGKSGGTTEFGPYNVDGGSGADCGISIESSGSNGNGGSGGSGGSSPSTIYAGGAGGAGWKSGSGYGAGISVQNAGGGGGGISNYAIYSYVAGLGYTPYTDSSTSVDASDGGKVGHYGTGGGGDSGFDDSGNFGTGGKGGDGVLVIEYPFSVSTISFEVSVTNGLVYADESSSGYSSMSFTVPINAKYSIPSVDTNSHTGRNTAKLIIYYDDLDLYTATIKSNAGYGNYNFASTGGVIGSNDKIVAKFSEVTYTGTVYLGTYYKQYQIKSPSAYAGTYIDRTTIEYTIGTYLDVDWTGGAYAFDDDIGTYEMCITTHSDTNNEGLIYSDGTEISSGNGKNLLNQNCKIRPNPLIATASYKTYYYKATVILYINDGTGISYKVKTDWQQTSSDSVYVSWSITPDRYGFTFLGWAKSSSATTPDYYGTSGYFSKGETKIYAVWSRNSYTITAKIKTTVEGVEYATTNLSPLIDYNLDGSSKFPERLWLSDSSVATMTSGVSITIPYESKFCCRNSSKVGSCFAETEWATEDGSTISYADNGYNTAIQTVTKDVTIVFKLTPYILTLKLDKNDSSGTTKLVDGTHYVRSDIQIPTYESLGWSGHKENNSVRFIGWAHIATTTSSTYDDGGTFSDKYQSEDGSDAAVTLYAIWDYSTSINLKVQIENLATALSDFGRPFLDIDCRHYGEDGWGSSGGKYEHWSLSDGGMKDGSEMTCSNIQFKSDIRCAISTIGVEHLNYIFKQITWKLTPGSSATSTVPADGALIQYFQNITNDSNLFVEMVPHSLSITFYRNDGSTTNNSKTVSGFYVWKFISAEEFPTLDWTNSEDSSAVLLGWSTDKDAKSITYRTDGYNVTSGREYYSSSQTDTLYAVWGHIVQVEFYKDDISGVHIDTIPTDPKTGKLTRSPTDLSNIGELEFKGWISTAWLNEKKSDEVASIKFDNTKAGTVYVYGKWSRLKYYPITFVTSKNVAYSIPDNTCTEWKNDIIYKTKDESVIFNPFTNTSAKWQQYQSSYNITYDYDKELKFSKINNVFYEVSAPSYNDGDIHMAVSCGKVGTIDLGTIQDISDSYSAILTTIPVVPLGYSGTFCMDTGVQRSLSVSVVRVSPVNPIDNSEATDSTQWSNAKWIRTLKELMDRWQMMTDGVKLHMYVPADRVNNVPPIDNKYTGASSTKSVNAYITSMPITYTSDSVHKVSMTISFKIGTIYPEPPKLKTNEITVYKDGTSTGEIFTYPADSYSALPRCPSGIISESSELFIGWKLNGAGSIKYPGDPFKVSDVSKLYAQYVSYNGAGELVEGSGSKTISVPAGASLVTICAVGGGGAGGGISDVPISDYSGYYSGTYVVRSGGGGGGSGQLSVRRVKLAEDTTQLHIYIGKGGQTEGANGEATVVRIGSETGKVLVRAMYGYGGGANKSGGPGGEGYNNGGSGGKWLGYKYMQAMVGSGSTNYGAAGKNYERDAASSAGRHYRCAGGGGGGAPPMIGDISKFTGDRYGGNGVTDEDENSHRDGTYGGGGGGGGIYSVKGFSPQPYFGKGGDGYVYLIWGSES